MASASDAPSTASSSAGEPGATDTGGSPSTARPALVQASHASVGVRWAVITSSAAVSRASNLPMDRTGPGHCRPRRPQ